MVLLLTPFRLFGRLLVVAFKITGYFMAFLGQALWHLAHRDTNHIGDAIGEFGRATTDALAALFNPR